jgi:hypothetical protein
MRRASLHKLVSPVARTTALRTVRAVTESCVDAPHGSPLSSARRMDELDPYQIDASRIDRLTRDLIAEYGLPLELVTVRHQPPAWLVIVAERSGRILTIELADTSTVRQLRERASRPDCWPPPIERAVGVGVG